MLMETCDDTIKLIIQTRINCHSGREIKNTDLIKKINFSIMEYKSIQLEIKTGPIIGSK